MAQHTPQPWLRDGLTVYALHHNGDYDHGKPRLVNRFSARVDALTHQGGTEEEAEANARLIAAAPDLLKAAVVARARLSRLNSNPEVWDDNYDVIHALDAAIALTEEVPHA